MSQANDHLLNLFCFVCIFQFYLNNHLNIDLIYHQDEKS